MSYNNVFAQTDATGLSLAVPQWQAVLSRVPVESCKLFLLGDGGVGKTALRRSLKELRAADHPLEHEDAPDDLESRTLGVEYDTMRVCENGCVGRNWRTAIRGWLGRRPTDHISLTVQDHGGQRGFHLVHDMFFQSAYAVYAIVIRIDKISLNEVERQLRYWLQFLLSTGNNGNSWSCGSLSGWHSLLWFQVARWL